MKITTMVQPYNGGSELFVQVFASKEAAIRYVEQKIQKQLSLTYDGKSCRWERVDNIYSTSFIEVDNDGLFYIVEQDLIED